MLRRRATTDLRLSTREPANRHTWQAPLASKALESRPLLLHHRCTHLDLLCTLKGSTDGASNSVYMLLRDLLVRRRYRGRKTALESALESSFVCISLYDVFSTLARSNRTTSRRGAQIPVIVYSHLNMHFEGANLPGPIPYIFVCRSQALILEGRPRRGTDCPLLMRTLRLSLSPRMLSQKSIVPA